MAVHLQKTVLKSAAVLLFPDVWTQEDLRGSGLINRLAIHVLLRLLCPVPSPSISLVALAMKLTSLTLHKRKEWSYTLT